MAKDRATTSKWPKRPPNTGVRLPQDLVIRAKHRALDEHITLRELIEAAIKSYLAKHG